MSIIIHIVPDNQIITSGLSLAAHRIAAEQQNRGLKVCVWSLNQVLLLKRNLFSCTPAHQINSFSRFLCLVVRNKVVIHFHGIWYPSYLFIWFVCILTGSKYHISLHGSYQPHALKIKYFKKRVFRFLFADNFIRKSNSIIVASEYEYKVVDRHFPKSVITLVPVGIERFNINYTSYENKNYEYAIVIARINKSKGISILIDAWRLIGSSNFKLFIAGPDENGYIKTLKLKVKELGLEDSILFLGEVHGDTKQRLIGNAKMLILPSLTENFGIVVPEALSMGTLVLSTTRTPWVSLGVENGCLCVDPNPSALLDGIITLKNISGMELQVIKENAKETAQQYFWDNIDVTSYLEDIDINKSLCRYDEY
jgi:glycosyltransferase involved in cell wall biosynthesis